MKILTITTVKDVYYTLPQAEREKLYNTSALHLINQKKKMGDKFHIYTAPGGTGYSIGEYDSLEEYSQGLLESPRVAAGFINIESVPLIEADEKAIKAFEERMKAAKK
jgi:hypothetical protein